MAIVAWGTVFYGHSVYMDALMRAHGWSSASISSAILVFWIASLPGTLSVGILVDRLGPVPVVAIGGCCIGGGLACLGQVSELWQVFAIYAAMGFGYPALASAAISATLTPWFNRGFGAALGVALTGASVGGALLPPIIVHHAARHGFDVTMMFVGGTVIAIVALAALALAASGRPKRPAGETASETPYSMAAVLRNGTFWAVAIPAALGLGGQVGFLAHQIPIIATDIGQIAAAFMVTVVAITSALGRLLVGLASRYLAVTTLAALSYSLHGVGIALLALSQSQTSILIACAVAGLTVGAIVMLPPLIVRHIYGTNGFGRTFAMVNVVMYVFAGLSPWLVGLLRDRLGDYSTALWLLVAMECAAALLILTRIPRRRTTTIDG